MRKKRKLFLFLFVLCCATVFAQKYQYIYYSGSEIPFKSVNQVVHDHLGYTWLATNEGLFRFDGTTFEDYNTGLRSKSIRAFEKWDEETILFSNDTGIHQISYKGNLPIIDVFKEGLRMQYPTNLLKDSRGDLWVGQLDGSIHKVSNNVFKPFELGSDGNQKTEEMFFGEDVYGAIWALIPGRGIYYLSSENGKFKKVKAFNNASHFVVDGDLLWIAGEALYKVRIHPDQGLESLLTIKSDQPFIQVVRKDEENFILAKESELFLFRHKEGEAGLKKMFGSNDPHRVEELPYQQIRHLVYDKTATQESIIWVSTPNGVGLMWSGFFQTVFGLGYDNVSGLHTAEDGRTLVSQGPVFEIGDKSGEMRFKAANSLSNLTGITTKGEQTWFGSTSGQIYQYQKDKLMKTYDLSNRGGGVFFMITDHLGEIWFCQATSNKPLLGTAKLDTKGNIIEYGADKGFESRILVVREGGKTNYMLQGLDHLHICINTIGTKTVL